MGRITWVCATCSQPFTRRTSATRHDNNKHRGQAEIVRLLEYIVGRGTGRYVCSKSLSYGDHQKWQVHNSNRGFGLATVADSAGARFISGNGPQEPQRGNMYKPPHYSATPMMGPAYSDDQLRAQEIGLKIKELKRLVIKYQEYLPNADGIINWAIHCSSKSDTKFLDEKLAQLHTMEASRGFQ
jgi:hypothetical protein